MDLIPIIFEIIHEVHSFSISQIKNSAVLLGEAEAGAWIYTSLGYSDTLCLNSNCESYFVLLETCMVLWDSSPSPFDPLCPSGPSQGCCLEIFPVAPERLIWLLCEIHYFLISMCFPLLFWGIALIKNILTSPERESGRAWPCAWVSLFAGLGGQHYYRNVQPEHKHWGLGLKNTLSFPVNICPPF